MKEEKSNLRKALKVSSVAVITIGVILMAMKIVADSEPGAIPLAMIMVGAVAYGVVHFRVSPRKM